MVLRAPVLAFACAFAALATLSACGEDGVTPSSCPPLPLYNPQVPEEAPPENPEKLDELDRAVDAGCATAIGSPRLATGGSGGSGQSAAGAGGADN